MCVCVCSSKGKLDTLLTEEKMRRARRDFVYCNARANFNIRKIRKVKEAFRK